MSSLAQMKENHHILMENYAPLTAAERKMLHEAGEILLHKAPVGCTGCRYCVDKGCPAGIPIPKVLESQNMIQQYQDRRRANLSFFQATGGLKKGADACIRCGACEKACPQRLPVTDLMVQASKEFILDGINVWANQ